MRLLFVHNRYRLAGGEDLAVELETGLLRQYGHEVETMLFDNNEVADDEGKWTALKHSIYNPRSAKKVTEAIQRFKPDLIHVHNLFFVASPAVLDAAFLARVPVLMTLHNYRLLCCNAILLRNGKPCEICRNSKLPLAGIRHKCYRGSASASALVTAITGFHKLRGTWQNKVAGYIALTEFAREKTAGSSLQVSVNRIHVLPNFVNDVLATGVQNERAPVPGNKRDPFFLFAGRLTREKGLLPLIDAFRAMPDLQLLVAGDGPDRAMMETEAGGADNIRFLGSLQRAELLDYMRRCRALVFPSIWYEGLPYVILESFCAGTPVIASRLGAMQAVVENEKNGLHFEPGNARDLAAKVRSFCDSGMPLYHGARYSWETKYAPASHYEALMKIYSGILQPV